MISRCRGRVPGWQVVSVRYAPAGRRVGAGVRASATMTSTRSGGRSPGRGCRSGRSSKSPVPGRRARGRRTSCPRSRRRSGRPGAAGPARGTASPCRRGDRRRRGCPAPGHRRPDVVARPLGSCVLRRALEDDARVVGAQPRDVEHGEGVAEVTWGRAAPGGVGGPLLAQLLAQLVLLLGGEQVGHVDLVDDEQQDDQPAGDQQLAEARAAVRQAPRGRRPAPRRRPTGSRRPVHGR